MTKTLTTMTAYLAAAWPLPALAQRGGYYPGGWGPQQMMGLGGGWFGGIFMLIFWILVIVVLVLGVRWLVKGSGGGASGSGAAGRSSPTPLDILKERYARGEIDREQYLSMRADLTE